LFFVEGNNLFPGGKRPKPSRNKKPDPGFSKEEITVPCDRKKLRRVSQLCGKNMQSRPEKIGKKCLTGTYKVGGTVRGESAVGGECSTVWEVPAEKNFMSQRLAFVKGTKNQPGGKSPQSR